VYVDIFELGGSKKNNWARKQKKLGLLNVESRNEVFNSLEFRKVDMPLADCNHAIECLIKKKMRKQPIKSREFCKICTLIIDLRWICLVEDVFVSV